MRERCPEAERPLYLDLFFAIIDVFQSRRLVETYHGCEIWAAAGRVVSFDQFDLLRSGPSIELFFAGDCVADITEVFAVDETMDVVAFGVGSGGSFAVVMTRLRSGQALRG
jgi:hypothetical protein